jgi:putative addiction module component (TIGR02574 family)
MGISADNLIREVMLLPYSDRAKLVDELIITLEPEKEENVSAAWALEVERRADELSRGVVVPVDWEEVKRKAVRQVHAGRNL